MKIIYLLFLLSLSACSLKITRLDYSAPVNKNNNCQVKIVEYDTSVYKLKPLGKSKIEDNFTIKCSEYEVKDLLRKEACNLGANLINLTNIKPPDLWSTCYRTNADFYLIDSNMKNGNNKPFNNTFTFTNNNYIDTFKVKYKNKGAEINFDLGLAPSLAGWRDDFAKEVLIPPPNGITSYIFGARLTNYFNSVGLDLSASYMMSEAVKENYKAKQIYNDYLFGLGISLIPYQYRGSSVLGKVYIRAGIIYDSFSFTDELENLISENLQQEFHKSADGFGYYVEGGYEILRENKMNVGIGLGYQNLTVKFDGASNSISTANIVIKISVGYHFVLVEN